MSLNPRIQSTECPIPRAQCTALALQLYNTMNHWWGLRRWSYYKTGLRLAEYGFGRGLGLAGFVLGLGLVVLVLVWSEWNDLADSIFFNSFFAGITASINSRTTACTLVRTCCDSDTCLSLSQSLIELLALVCHIILYNVHSLGSGSTPLDPVLVLILVL